MYIVSFIKEDSLFEKQTIVELLRRKMVKKAYAILGRPLHLETEIHVRKLQKLFSSSMDMKTL